MAATGKRRILRGLACGVALIVVIYTVCNAPGVLRYIFYQPVEGDFVFQPLPRFELVRVIEGVTGSSYSHVGLIVRKDGAWYVREAMFDVHDTALWEWVMRGRGSGFDVFRLRPEFRPDIPSVIEQSVKYLGRPYNYRYRLDDETLYCSELVFKSYRDATGRGIGRLETLGSLNWKPYQKLIEKYEGGPIPLDRQMISPASIARAPELERVY